MSEERVLVGANTCNSHTIYHVVEDGEPLCSVGGEFEQRQLSALPDKYRLCQSCQFEVGRTCPLCGECLESPLHRHLPECRAGVFNREREEVDGKRTAKEC